MATQADELVKEDLLDRYVHARMRVRALSASRTTRICGPVPGAASGSRRRDAGGWSVCPLCGRYA